jgi:hypothetical protein
MPPPPGEVSNLDNPPNSNHLALGVQVGTFVITTIFFLLRMYGRVVMLKKFQAEESECFPPAEVLEISNVQTRTEHEYVAGDRWAC